MAAAIDTFDDLGIRFDYPSDWALEVDRDGTLTTVSVHSPGGTAFAMISIDETRPDPDDVAAEALGAMKEEYDTLDASPAQESIAGHDAVGHDAEFLSLDLPSACAIRSFRTARHTVLVFGQWAEVESDSAAEEQLAALRSSFEESADVGATGLPFALD